MNNSLAIKSGLAALGGVGVVGGGVVLGKNIFFPSSVSKEKPKVLISKVLEKSLMSVEDVGLASKWTERKTKLGGAENGYLIPSLRVVKDKSGYTEEDIKNWCKENVNGFEDDEDGKKLKNVSDFCTFNIKDKITKTLVTGSWETANGKLKQVEDGLLSQSLIDVKNALNKGSGADTDSLKRWCESEYAKMFIGEEDRSFKDASTYCVTP